MYGSEGTQVIVSRGSVERGLLFWFNVRKRGSRGRGTASWVTRASVVVDSWLVDSHVRLR